MKIIFFALSTFFALNTFAMNSSWQAQIEKQQELNKILGGYSQTGDLEGVIRLIEKGADPIEPSCEGGSTPLMKASYHGHVAVVTYLVGCGASINEVDRSLGFSPFHAACKEGHLEVVKYLAENGASLNVLTKAGDTPYFVAKRYAKDNIARFIYDLMKKNSSEASQTKRHG